MRCFTVTEHGVTPYIVVASAPYPHVEVGEEGRGRVLTRFPVARRFFDEVLAHREPCPNRGREMFGGWVTTCRECGVELVRLDTPAPSGADCVHPDTGEIMHVSPIERASVIRTKEKGTFLLVEEQDPQDQRALVLARIHGGFRGWSEYQFPKDGGFILASGYAAEGLAGRAGGPHYEYLLVMEPGATFKVVRGGRLYGDPEEIYVHWTGVELRRGTKDEVWPPTDEAAEGEVI